MKFAAIDIGSNAIRLLFANVIELNNKVMFKKSSLFRVPIRLGEDVFTSGEIGIKKIDLLLKTMQAFKLLIEVHEVVSFRAVATSAMREAKNGPEIIDEIYQKCGLSIEIISGNTEADLIFQNKDDDELKSDVPYLFIDVGGGSTELSLFKNKKLIASQSFNLGTVRMLHNQINPKEWDFLDYWIEENVRKYKNVVAIGSGGNINKLYKIAKRKTNKPLILEQLVEINSLLSKMNVSQRIAKYGLNPDRADVIVPAAKIYIHAMKAAEIHEILVPQIGVSDGIVHQLYEDFKQKNKH